MFSKKIAIERFRLSTNQCIKIEKYIQLINHYNNHTNIVGKSTLADPWKSHVLDSLQICKFIPDKNCSILDMGTGAGIPGLILAMCNFSNIYMVDSNSKKINFVKSVCSKLNIKATIYKSRIEKLASMKFDFLVSRALTNLNKLLFYSQQFLNNNTVLVFLKGKTINDELVLAEKNWSFQYSLKKSISDERGSVIIIKNLCKINA